LFVALVSLHSLDQDGIKFFEDAGYPLASKGKAWGWWGEMDESDLWVLAKLAFEEGLAVKLRHYSETRVGPTSIVLQLDSNKWHFRQH
jgi:hypothetical protein